MFTTLTTKLKYFIFSFFLFVFSLNGMTQISQEEKKTIPTGYSKTVSAGINITIPEFSQTHIFGISAGFSWSKNRFGLMDKRPSKLFGFITDGGIDCYFGKEETVSGYPYKYNSFIYIHTYGGVIFNCFKRGNLNLTTGPAVGIESGYTNFFFGVNLSGAFYINENFSIIPCLQLIKDPESYDPLLSVALKASFAFL